MRNKPTMTRMNNEEKTNSHDGTNHKEEMGDACCNDYDNAIVRKRKTMTKNDCNYNANINGDDKDKCDTTSVCEINKQKLRLCIYYFTTTRILRTTR